MSEFTQRQERTRSSHLVSPAKPERATLRPVHTENPLLAQQQALGNQATQRFAQSCPMALPSPSLCPFGGVCHSCPAQVQAKLKVGQPGDKYEQEADRVAEQVMRMPEASYPASEGEGQEWLQAKPLAGTRTSPTDPSLPAWICSLRGDGLPLPGSVRDFFEPRFGYNFDQVRIHTGARAAEAAAAVHAHAFTWGRDVVFGEGEYAPGAAEWKRLLAHELTHVIQQNGPRIGPHNRGAGSNTLGSASLQRVPVVMDCDETETGNVIEAQETAIRWLRFATGKLSAPDDVAPELSYHFLATPTDRSTIEIIQSELQNALDAISGDYISYTCALATDPACTDPDLGEIAGFAELGSLEASFCGELVQDDGDVLVDTLIHEVMHAKDPGIDDGPYRGDPDYPGLIPVENTDAYAAFVRDVIGGISGLPERPEEEQFIYLPEEGSYSSYQDAMRLTTDLRGFPRDDAALSSAALSYLDIFLEDWATSFSDGPLRLSVAGYTDGTSARERSTRLGEMRAELVRDYLLKNLERWYIPMPQEVVVMSYGASRPSTSSRTARGKAINRRVRIEVARLRPSP